MPLKTFLCWLLHTEHHTGQFPKSKVLWHTENQVSVLEEDTCVQKDLAPGGEQGMVNGFAIMSNAGLLSAH